MSENSPTLEHPSLWGFSDRSYIDVARACDRWWKRRFPDYVTPKFGDFSLKKREPVVKMVKVEVKKASPEARKASRKSQTAKYWQTVPPEVKKARMDKINKDRKLPEGESLRRRKAYQKQWRQNKKSCPEQKERNRESARRWWATLTPEQKRERRLRKLENRKARNESN